MRFKHILKAAYESISYPKVWKIFHTCLLLPLFFMSAPREKIDAKFSYLDYNIYNIAGTAEYQS